MNFTRENLPKNAVIYCRVSSTAQAQADKTGLPVQNQVCRDFISQNGLTFVAAYEENGSAYKNRSGTLATVIRRHRNTTLVVYSVDRFSRNQQDGMHLAQVAQSCRVAICFAMDGFVLNQTTMPTFQKKLEQSEAYSRQLGERVSKALKMKRDQGFFAGGPLPFGYVTQQETGGKRLVPDQDEQHVITFIAYCLRQNKNRNVTAVKLNELMANITGEFAVRRDPIRCYDEDGAPVDRLDDTLSSQDIADLLNDYNVRRRGNRWTGYAVSSAWSRHQTIQNDPNNLAHMMDDMTMGGNKRSRRSTTNRRAVPIPVAPQGMFEFHVANATALPRNVPYVAVRNPNYDSDEYVDDDNMDVE